MSNCEYERALTSNCPEKGGSYRVMKAQDPNHLIALNHVINRNVVVGQATLDGDTQYYLNPEKACTELKLPTKRPTYLRINRPTDVQESQEYAKLATKLRRLV